MGTVTAQTLINRAAYVLEDTGNVSWTRIELLGWLNEGQSQVVAYSPGANTDRAELSLVAGTKQTLPNDTIVLVDVPRNTNGPVVRVVGREILDNAPVDWHTTTPTKLVKNYVYDANDQYTFYVYPPNNGAGQVTIVYARVPDQLTSEAQFIEVDDSYQAAILDFMLYRAYSKDTDYVAGGTEKATAYYGAFKDAISARNNLQAVLNTNNALAPANAGNQGSLR